MAFAPSKRKSLRTPRDGFSERGAQAGVTKEKPCRGNGVSPGFRVPGFDSPQLCGKAAELGSHSRRMRDACLQGGGKARNIAQRAKCPMAIGSDSPHAWRLLFRSEKATAPARLWILVRSVHFVRRVLGSAERSDAACIKTSTRLGAKIYFYSSIILAIFIKT